MKMNGDGSFLPSAPTPTPPDRCRGTLGPQEHFLNHRLFFLQSTFAMVFLVACPLYGGGTYETYAGGNITPNGGNHSYTEDIGTGSSTFSGNGSDYSYAASSTAGGLTATVDVEFDKGPGLESGDAGAFARCRVGTGKIIPAGWLAHITASFTVTITGSIEGAHNGLNMSAGIEPEFSYDPANPGVAPTVSLSHYTEGNGMVTSQRYLGSEIVDLPSTGALNHSYTFNELTYDWGPSNWASEVHLNFDLNGWVSSDGSGGHAKATISITGVSISLVLDPPADPTAPTEMVWTNPAGGSFATEQNWTPEVVPVKDADKADTATFILDDTYTVNTGTHTTERLRVTEGDVTINATDYTVASLSQENPSLIVNGDAILQLRGEKFNSVHTIIGGESAGDSKSAEVWLYNSDLHWHNQGRLTVGGKGRGGLAMTGGPSINSGETRIGDEARGEARVGKGSVWNTGNLVLGIEADGLLEMDPGSTLVSGNVVLGLEDESRGDLIIGQTPTADGENVPLFDSDSLLVGFLGAGNLVVQGGAYAETQTLSIRSNVGDQGGVLVSGSGAGGVTELTASNFIYVGEGRPGLLAIFDGGHVSSPVVRVGDDVGFGEVLLGTTDDPAAESTLVADTLTVGSTDAQGTLKVHENGRVYALTAEIGSPQAPPDRIARAEFTGVGSAMAVQQSLRVRGNGVLEVTHGSVAIGFIGDQPGWVNIGAGGLLGGTGTIVCPGNSVGNFGGVDNFGGTVGPGESPGTLTIEGNYEQGTDGVLEIEIGGPATGFDYDQLAVTGTVTFAPGAKIRITFIDPNPEDAFTDAFAPRTGDTFNFLTAAAINLPAGGSLSDHIEFTNLPADVELAFETVSEGGVSRLRATTTAAPPAPTVGLVWTEELPPTEPSITNAVVRLAYEDGTRRLDIATQIGSSNGGFNGVEFAAGQILVANQGAGSGTRTHHPGYSPILVTNVAAYDLDGIDGELWRTTGDGKQIIRSAPSSSPTIFGGLHDYSYTPILPVGIDRFTAAVQVVDSTVYFSTQSANPVGLYRMDTDGRNQTGIFAASDSTAPVISDFEVVGNVIYFGDATSNAVRRINTDGSGLVTLVANVDSPSGIDVTAEAIYWSESQNGRIRRSDLDGGNVIDLITGLNNPRGVAVVPLSIVALSETLAEFLAKAGVPSHLREPDGDPDNDGLSNWLEFALDLDPMGNRSSPYNGSRPSTTTNSSLFGLSYHRARNDLTYLVETTTDLANPVSWTSDGVDQGVLAEDGTVTATIPISGGSRFLRLSVTR